MKRKFTLLLLIVSLGLFAQEEEKKRFNLSGSVDAYYQTFLTAPDNLEPSFGTAFADQTGFALGMGNLIASYEGDKVGVVLDLVVGPRGASATFNSDIVDGIVNQAYVYWNISEKTTLTFGRWNTFLGYEVIAPAANFNYSTSYLFSSGPFSHLGLKADFALSDDFSLMLAITNPWDVNDTSTTGEYALGAQLGFKDQYLNIYYDSGNNGGLGFEIDYTGGFNFTEDFFLGINAAYNDNSGAGFYGAALYPQYTFTDTFALGLRGEYFSLHGSQELDEGTGNLVDIPDPSVFATTLTGSFTIESLIIKPELRLDSLTNATGGLYGNVIDNDGAPADSLAAFTLAAIYTF